MSHTSCAHSKAGQLIIAKTFLQGFNTLFLIQEKIIKFSIYTYLLAWETELFICMNISKVGF